MSQTLSLNGHCQQIRIEKKNYKLSFTFLLFFHFSTSFGRCIEDRKNWKGCVSLLELVFRGGGKEYSVVIPPEQTDTQIIVRRKSTTEISNTKLTEGKILKKGRDMEKFSHYAWVGVCTLHTLNTSGLERAAHTDNLPLYHPKVKGKVKKKGSRR